MHDSGGEFPRLFQYKSVFLKDRATGRTDSPQNRGKLKTKICRIGRL